MLLILILANLPLPFIIYLNWQVTMKYLRVRKLSKHVPVDKPHRFAGGWWLSNAAIIFILVPPLTEHRLFVEDPRWLVFYATAASLTIAGLLLMNSALSEELRDLARHHKRKQAFKPVDSNVPDTL